MKGEKKMIFKIILALLCYDWIKGDFDFDKK